MESSDPKADALVALRDVGLPFSALRDSGLLWLFNRVVFHPRGFALALHYKDGEAIGWSLLGDGTEPWSYADSMEDEEQALFEKVNRLLSPGVAKDP